MKKNDDSSAVKKMLQRNKAHTPIKGDELYADKGR